MKTKLKRGSGVRSCSCEHEFQDSWYGKKIRVFNRAPASNAKERARCSVCCDLRNLNIVDSDD